MQKRLADLLTIVIPSKNEKWVVLETLEHLADQVGIEDTKIIVADSSTEHFSKFILKNFTKRLANKVNYQLIEGGFPADARRKASLLVDTPYVLFLDADVHIRDKYLLYNIFKNGHMKETDLLTCKMSTEQKWSWVYRWFDRFQKISVWLGTPFAVGSFQLWNMEAYWLAGGYNPEYIFAEDYALSKNVNPKRFKVYDTDKVWTYARRFRKKGVWYMAKLMFKSYLNRNNPDFFKSDHGYWK
jgi:glycosyltransferase involved in cell wall biosynthesis